MARIIKGLPHLPAERALRLISGRWKVNILYYVLEGPRRLSELKRLLPGSSQKVLVQQLRELEAHGILTRKVFAEVPPRVEYSTTRLGRSLKPVVGALCKWGTRHAPVLDAIDGPSAASAVSAASAASAKVARRSAPAGYRH
jgi:DNA-binding HxlR family transcriptional regulator